MRELSEKLGEMEFDGLITGLNPAVRVTGGTIAKLTAAATYKRGSVLAKSANDGLLYLLGTAAASGDTLTPDCILCDDTEIGADEDVPVTVYAAGCFDPEKLTVSEGYTVTEEDRDKLRAYSIIFKAASPAE